ncbi:asparagine synthetase domain-containing protein CG17486 isoform X2 [Plodia interpunctella]|uniref:asparagine synthetase domain-containing protein CG17486 isoform X2 n=1 Tax=Plodia interpunctella TaxID=58824 RepID=UPI00236768EE|nr:asparagine synthetase domain-containing protein CG17486 isoform X2 [Plodia interpunctella]
MCGIICEICYTGKSLIRNDDRILERNKNRGPDCNSCTEIYLDDGITILFYGSVLWMQGLEPTVQPVQTETGVLLYNGDIFDETWTNEKSDTQQIMEKLDNASILSSEDIVIELKSLKGRKYECIEVPATHIYVLNIKSNDMTLVPWNCEISDTTSLEEWKSIVQNQQCLPDDEFIFPFDDSIQLDDKDNIVKYIENVTENTTGKLDVMKKLMDNNIINDMVSKIIDLLSKSVQIRLKQQPNKCKDCLASNNTTCNHCTTGILFSGGLDCSILAFMANKYLPEEQIIDLINVAFEKDGNSTFEVPDRKTGKQSLQELRKLCPSRKWVFKEVNITREMLEIMQESIIGDLVYPRQTILDESLGSALWFAARGEDEKNVSPCRVLLLGSGADELFGGYTRHRNAFKRKGWTGLRKELLLDWSRISFRNLARDNRVICDHGRQPRLPYLDEDFSKFVLELKPWLKCFPAENLENGIGDKLMLRLVAYKLGLIDVATLPKRALQFGSRIANKKEKGSDISKTFRK